MKRLLVLIAFILIASLSYADPTPVPTYYVNYVNDDFQRANQAGWGTATSGQTWTGNTSTYTIDSNTGRANGGGGLQIINSGHSDIILQTTIVTSWGGNDGLAIRYSDDNNWIEVYRSGIWQQVATSWTQVTSWSSTWTNADVITVYDNAGNITVYQNTTLLGTAYTTANLGNTGQGFFEFGGGYQISSYKIYDANIMPTPTPVPPTPTQSWQTNNSFGTEIRGFYKNVSEVAIAHNWNAISYEANAVDGNGNYLIKKESNAKSVTFTAVDAQGTPVITDIEYRVRK